MEAYLIPTHSEFDCYNSHNFCGALAITQCNMLMFPFVFAEADEVSSDFAHVPVCTAINYVSGCALDAGDV